VLFSETTRVKPSWSVTELVRETWMEKTSSIVEKSRTGARIATAGARGTAAGAVRVGRTADPPPAW